MLNNVSNNSVKDSASIINDNQRQLIAFVNYIIICGVISIFGTIANVINMVVFYRQGLDTTINISFFSLAVSDLCSMIFQQLFNVYINPLFIALDLPIVYLELQYLTTALNREMFARITCLITAFITAERCLCVVFPLQVKQIITPKTTTLIVTAIFTFTLISPLPAYLTYKVTWTFNPHLNRTLLGMTASKENSTAEAFGYFFHALVTFIGFVSVLIFTLILIYKLRQRDVWRQTSQIEPEKAKSISKRDRSTISMVVLIAGVLVVCYTPAVLLCVSTFLLPEFHIGGKYTNLSNSLWSVAILFENINSSVNIFLYYRMSSKYRSNFQELFSGCLQRDKNVCCEK